MPRTLVLKLGGSLITDKERPYALRGDVLKQAAAEIRSCLDESLVQRLVIVHGVGSYGHPPVIQYKLHKGFIDPSQLLPISRTQSKVNELRAAVTSSLQDEGVPVNLFHTSSIATAKKGRIVSLDLDAVKGFLKIGMVPVLGGDMVHDIEMGFSVGSGDQVAVILAKELGATDIVFATDVAGVYDADPKRASNAKLIPELNLGHLNELAASGATKDASGAMRGKVLALNSLDQELRQGLKASIISMMAPGRLRALLKGERIEATAIVP